MEHLQDVRLIRDKIIECEVETRKVRSDNERVVSQIEREDQAHKSKMDELNIEKKQIKEDHENFKKES